MDCRADGLSVDFACGYEVCGNCAPRREFFDQNGQANGLAVKAIWSGKAVAGWPTVAAAGLTATSQAASVVL